MITTLTWVLWLSCNIILPLAIRKLLWVLLAPALLVTSLMQVGIMAGSYAIVAGSSITIVSSISIVVVPIAWSCGSTTL